jgi:predicted nucleotidyltransferase
MNQIDFNNEQVINLYNKYHVKTLRIFGSMARGESRIDSDVDLLVTFSKPISLLQMVGLERELSIIIGRKVDLLTTKSVSRYLRNSILKESRQIYAT